LFYFFVLGAPGSWGLGKIEEKKERSSCEMYNYLLFEQVNMLTSNEN